MPAKGRYDNVFQCFIGGREYDELTEVEKQMHKRILTAYSLLQNYHDLNIVVHMLIDYTKKIEGIKPISRSTAYKDIKQAQDIFGQIEIYQPEYMRMIIAREARKDMVDAEKMAQWAKDNGKYKIWNDAKTRKEKAYAILVKAMKLDQNKDESIDMTKLEGHQYIIAVDAAFEKAAKQLTKGGGTLDLNEMLKDVIEEVEYVELPKNTDNSESNG